MGKVKLIRETISTSIGLNAQPRVKARRPEPEELTLQAIFRNLFGFAYIARLIELLGEHDRHVTSDHIYTWLNGGYLPPDVARIIYENREEYIQRKQIEREIEHKIHLQHWRDSEKICILYGAEAFEKLYLSGKNERAVIGTSKPGGRKPRKQRTNITEALARAAAPTPDDQRAANQADTRTLTPNATRAPTISLGPDPLDSVFDAAFGPKKSEQT